MDVFDWIADAVEADEWKHGFCKKKNLGSKSD